MRDNWNLNIRGEKVLLVPFTKDLVEKYHGWMQDPYLLEMTGSEPLTLQEEYEMQEDWRQDENKCTFIMKTKDALTGGYVMVGDMNLFLCRSGDPAPGALVAEINVMVAEERFRKCGLAMETILMTMHYGVKRLGIDRFMCKIQENNEASRCLFLR